MRGSVAPALLLLALAAGASAAVSVARAGGGDGLDERGGREGRELYREHCGICHLEGGTGTFMLARRLSKERALLESRDDLSSAFVAQVVRHGLASMPRFTRVELPDGELQAIESYLSAKRTPGKAGQ